MFSTKNAPLSATDIERIKPYLQMAVKTNQLDNSTLKLMLSVLTKSVTSSERQTPKLLSRKEIAIILGGISVKTVNRLVEAGKLKPKKIGKRLYKFSLEEVVEYMENGYDKEA